MKHGGEIYDKQVELDFSVSLNPMPVAEELRQALDKSLSQLSHYPDTEQRSLREALSKAEGAKPTEILAGNGASELLFAIAAAEAPRKVTLVEPGFYGYRHALMQRKDCRIESLEWTEPEEVPKLLKKACEDTELLFLCDPWNPTGQRIAPELLKELLKRAKERGIAVVLDRSFYYLSEGEALSASGLLAENDKLYILYSCTKLFSLPGIRMGYVIAKEAATSRLLEHLPEWNLSVPAMQLMEAGARLLEDGTFVRESLSLIEAERKYLTEALSARAFKVYGSDTVFLLFSGAEGLYEALLAKKILIRRIEKTGADHKAYYRIAVKDHASNLKLIDALDEVLNDGLS